MQLFPPRQPHFSTHRLIPILGDSAQHRWLLLLSCSPPDQSHGGFRNSWQPCLPNPGPKGYAAHVTQRQPGSLKRYCWSVTSVWRKEGSGISP